MKNKIQILILLFFLGVQIDFCFSQGFVVTSASNTCSSCDGTALFTTNTTGIITYSWFSSDNNLLFSETNNTGSSIVSNLCPGIYYLVASYPNNTDSTTYFNVETNLIANLPFEEISICSTASSLNLNDYIPSGVDNSGSWTTPNNILTTGNLTAPITSGIYQYTLQEGVCDVVSGIKINVNEPANPGLTTTYLICENYEPFVMTDFLNGNPDYGGIWFDSNNAPISDIYNPAIQNTELFTYYIDTVAGCNPVFSTLYIIENNLPNAGTPSEVTMCETGPSVDLYNYLEGNPETDGTWYNENFQTIATPFVPSENDAGVFTYLVPGNTPCPSVQNQLTINYTPGVFSGTGMDTTFCENNETFNLFNLLSGTVSSNGIWTNQSNQFVDSLITINQSQAGVYTYSVSLAGCSNQQTNVVVNIETPLNAGTDTLIELCETLDSYNLNNALSMDASPNGIWLANNMPTPDVVDILETGNLVFTYQTNTQVCAQDQATITIQIDESINAGMDSTVSLCQTDPPLSLFNFLTGESDDTGSWLFNNQPISNIFSPQNSSEGDYIYMLNSINSCPNSQATITINIIDSINFPSGTMLEYCNYNQEVNIGEQSEEGCDYLWTPTDYLSSDDVSNPSIQLSEISSPSTLIYQIAISNGSCQKNVQRAIQIYSPPSLSIDSLFSDCEGETLVLNAGNFGETNWSPAELFTNSQDQIQNITLSTSTTITLTVADQNNCSSTKDIQIEVFPLPNLSYSISQSSLCTPASIQITNTSENEFTTAYDWNFSNANVEDELVINFEFDAPVSFNFSLTGTTEHGCTKTINSEDAIEVFQMPNALFSTEEENLSIFNNQLTVNNSSHFATEYEWTLNDAVISQEESPTINLPQVADQNNLICLEVYNHVCTDTTCRNVYIPLEQNIFIPNTFTPNNDQLNDVFKPILLEDNILDYTFVIYNRWGEIVFQTKDTSEGWIGDTEKNHSYYAQDGVYIWKIKFKEKNILGEQTYTGTVTLIR